MLRMVCNTALSVSFPSVLWLEEQKSLQWACRWLIMHDNNVSKASRLLNMTKQRTGCGLQQPPNYFQQYIIDALTTDVLLSPVHCVPSSSITSSYLSPLFFPLTPVLFTNELPGCSQSIPPISATAYYSLRFPSDKTALYLSTTSRSIVGKDIKYWPWICVSVTMDQRFTKGSWLLLVLKHPIFISFLFPYKTFPSQLQIL